MSENPLDRSAAFTVLLTLSPEGFGQTEWREAEGIVTRFLGDFYAQAGQTDMHSFAKTWEDPAAQAGPAAAEVPVGQTADVPEQPDEQALAEIGSDKDPAWLQEVGERYQTDGEIPTGWTETGDPVYAAGREWEQATGQARHLAVAADTELRRRHPDQTADILARLGTPEQRRDYAQMEAKRLHDEARTEAQAAYDRSGVVPGDTNQYRRLNDDIRAAWLDYQEAAAHAENNYRDETAPAAEPEEGMTQGQMEARRLHDEAQALAKSVYDRSGVAPVLQLGQPAADMTQEQRDRAAEYTDGYRRGRADAWNGTRESTEGRGEQRASGYAAGHKWGSSHPAPYGKDRAAEEADPAMQARLARGRASLEALVDQGPPVDNRLTAHQIDEQYWPAPGEVCTDPEHAHGINSDAYRSGPDRELENWNITSDHADGVADLDYEAGE